MLKKTITYTDYNGNERSQTYYFNLSKAEIAKMEMGVKGGFAEYIKRIIDAQDTPALAALFEDLIKKSYGVKSLDGNGFYKRASDLEEFMATEAYSQLYMELATNADAASEFMNGIVPADMSQKVKEVAKN